MLATSPLDGSFINLETNLDDSLGVGLNSYLGKLATFFIKRYFLECGTQPLCRQVVNIFRKKDIFCNAECLKKRYQKTVESTKLNFVPI